MDFCRFVDWVIGTVWVRFGGQDAMDRARHGLWDLWVWSRHSDRGHYRYVLPFPCQFIHPATLFVKANRGLTLSSAYASDVFPDHTVEASSIINAFRVWGGFIVNYFLVNWAESDGPVVSFGAQAGIVGGAFLLIITVQVFGSRWRGAFPSPKKQT